MRRYLIYACDDYFDGYHGMDRIAIEECQDLDEACALGESYSIEVIESYPDIYDIMKDRLDELISNGYSNEEELWDEVIQDDIKYEVTEINEDKAGFYLTDELEEMAINDYGNFYKKFT